MKYIDSQFVNLKIKACMTPNSSIAPKITLKNMTDSFLNFSLLIFNMRKRKEIMFGVRDNS